MLNQSRSSCVRSVLFGLLLSAVVPSAFAQAAPSQHPELDRQLGRLDLGVVAVAVINKDSNGTATVNGVANTEINLHPGNTVGPVVTLRYTKSPWIGFELNYGYARYTDTFSKFGTADSGPIGVQQNASEYTAGYVAHIPHPVFGLTPFISAGLGTTAFRPTPGGGQSLINQARMTYYYSAGLEKSVFSPHFGVRAIYRQTFFLAPDFGQNYLTIKQRTSTFEPGFGIFLKY